MEKVITRFHFSPLGLWLYGFAQVHSKVDSLELKIWIITKKNIIIFIQKILNGK